VNRPADRFDESRAHARLGVRRTILVVEKEPAIRKLISEMLEGGDFEVVTSASAVEALGFKGHHGNSLDLLLTEAYPNGLSVQELSRMLHKRYPGLKILIMSGKFDEGFAAMLGNHVDRLFLLKPFTRRLLLKKIDDILG
jgi:CheY-like chemotaxis protein